MTTTAVLTEEYPDECTCNGSVASLCLSIKSPLGPLSLRSLYLKTLNSKRDVRSVNFPIQTSQAAYRLVTALRLKR